MLAAEQLAQRLHRKLLVLDTAGEAAERLYAALGYEVSGAIPDFAMTPDGTKLEPTKIMYKRL